MDLPVAVNILSAFFLLGAIVVMFMPETKDGNFPTDHTSVPWSAGSKESQDSSLRNM